MAEAAAEGTLAEAAVEATGLAVAVTQGKAALAAPTQLAFG